MRLVLTNAAWIGLAISTGSVPLLAQLRDNSEKQMICANAGNDNGRGRHCEIREQSFPSIGRPEHRCGPERRRDRERLAGEMCWSAHASRLRARPKALRRSWRAAL
jgi:hypothetical protein